MNWSSFPLELQEKILIQLPSCSIPQCKQVCKSWKDFIETKLNKNMFGEVPKFVKTVETIEVVDLGVDGKEREFDMLNVFENNIVFQSDDEYNREDYINLMVYNLVTRDTWTVGSIGPLAKEDTSINKTLLAINYKSNINLVRLGHKVLKVFSLETKAVVFEDIVPDTLCKIQLDQSSSRLILLYTMKIEVLSFNNNSFSRFSCNTQVPLHFDDYESAVENDVNVMCWESATYMSFPNLSHFETSEEDGKHQISAFVWKIDDQKKQIKRHKYFADFGSCLQLTYDKIALMGAFYVSSSFIVITEEDPSLNAESYNFLLKVLNEEGELLKRIQLNDHSFEMFGTYMYENRLVINSFGRRGKGETNVFNLKELLNSEANNNVSMKRFPELNLENSFYSLDCTSIVNVDPEEKEIIVSRLDFWVNG